MRKILFLTALASLLLLAANLGYGMELNWSALTNGGSSYTTGIYTLDSAIGQPIVGLTTSPSGLLCSGFLCGANTDRAIYLPVVRR